MGSSRRRRSRRRGGGRSEQQAAPPQRAGLRERFAAVGGVWAVVIAAGVIGLVVFAIFAVGGSGFDSSEDPLLGDEVEIGQADHVQTLAQMEIVPGLPPAGGPHFPVWLDPGIYGSPVSDGEAVHSLEHGMVWISYNPRPGRRGTGRRAERGRGGVRQRRPALPAPGQRDGGRGRLLGTPAPPRRRRRGVAGRVRGDEPQPLAGARHSLGRAESSSRCSPIGSPPITTTDASKLALPPRSRRHRGCSRCRRRRDRDGSSGGRLFGGAPPRALPWAPGLWVRTGPAA